jgi:hypothetical protein
LGFGHVEEDVEQASRMTGRVAALRVYSQVMGTWGDGLYDNDGVLDGLSALLGELDDHSSPAHFVAATALRLWMKPVALGLDPARTQAWLDARKDWIDALPAPARQVFAQLHEDPAGYANALGSRSADVEAVLGGYCDGRREDALIAVSGVRETLEELAERCRAALDELAEEKMYELAGKLAPLGVLLELSEVGIVTSPDRVAVWKHTFEQSAAATEEEREFFDGYAARVRRGFDLLTSRARVSRADPGSS